MALTPASILADYTSGIGTQGATLKVNTSNKRVGIGTTNPQGTLQVGTGITMGSGIVTATSFDANTASFSGNVSVGGVLTYEDVTNVDSVGVITARNGIVVSGGATVVGLSTFTKISIGHTEWTGYPALAPNLHVHSNVPETSNACGISFGPDPHGSGPRHAHLVWQANNQASFWVFGGSLQLAADQGVGLGNDVGIGTTSSPGSERLHVVGDSKFVGILTATTLQQTQTYPIIRPTLDLNFAATKALDRRITFTRDGVGTYVDELGIVKYASNNVPRFDHNPTTGESLGLLIEEARTNVLYGTPSQSNTINSYNQYNSLTGEYDATKLAKNSPSSSQSHGSWNWNGNVSTSSFVMSIFVKKVNHASFFIQMISSGVGDNLYVYFNIDTKVTSIVDNASPGNLTVTRSIENYGDGWFRLVARVEGFSNTALHSGIAFGFASGGSDTQGYQDTSDEVLIYGAQAEVGNFVTSYIPTHESTTSVTRGSDQAKITGTNFTDFHNATEGTLYGEYKATLVDNAPYLVMLSDGTDNNRTIVNTDYSSYQGVVKYNNGTNQAVLDGGTPTLGGNNKTTLAFKKDDFALSLNGGTVATDTSGDVSVNNMMTIGSRHGIDSFVNSTIKSIKYYNKRVPNDQLQGLTA
jgi:hypothetical protein